MRLAAGVLLLSLLAGGSVASPVVIGSGRELIQALTSLQESGGAIQLRTDVRLAKEDLEGAEVPAQVRPETTMILQGGAGIRNLDFGELPMVLNIQSGGTLHMQDLNVSGLADPATPPPGVETAIQSLHIWPSILGESNAAVSFRDVNLTLFPSPICSPDVVAGRIRQLQLFTGLDNSSVWGEGLIGHFHNFSIPLPIIDLATQKPVGAMAFTSLRTNMTCTPTSFPPGGSNARGWLSYAAAAAAVVAAAAAQAVASARRRRAAAMQQQSSDGVGNLVDSPGRRLSLGRGGSGVLFETRQGGSMRDSLWRSKMGVIEGLQIGGILGRGGFGAVYTGKWRGTTVAVKIVPTSVGPDQRIDLGIEPLLSLSLSHPNILAAYKVCVVRLLTDAEAAQAVDGAASKADGGARSGSGSSAPPTPGGDADPPAVGSGPSSGQGGSDTPPAAAGTSPTAAAKPPAGTGTPPADSGGGKLSGSGGSRRSGTSSSGRRILQSLKDSSTLVEVMPADAVLEPGHYEAWLVSEMADKGSLADAIAAGTFRTGDPPALNMQAVLLCLLDIARGLEYLHDSGILHGDLKSQNVLLKSVRTDKRGYVAKLCDFGLSRLIGDLQTHVDTGSYGTATHAAPELLQEGRLTRASDIFALSIIMWELVSGTRPYKGMSPMQVIVAVTQRGVRPPVPEDCPPRLAALMQRCWDADPQARPDTGEVIRELLALGKSLFRATP
ncbi:hypothetical protein ABPG77_006568 [Micractinium sp. CCAP 211/92]